MGQCWLGGDIHRLTPVSPQTFYKLNAWKEEFTVQCHPPQPETFPFVVVGNKCDVPKATASWCPRATAVRMLEVTIDYGGPLVQVARSVAEQWCHAEGVPVRITSGQWLLAV